MELEWRRPLQIPWAPRKRNEWVLEQIKPEASLEAKWAKLKVPCFGSVLRRQGSLGETMMLGQAEGSRGRGRPNVRPTDSTEEAIGMSLQCWTGLLRTGHGGHHSFRGSPGVRSNSTAGYTRKMGGNHNLRLLTCEVYGLQEGCSV